jgi:hypothetical protein
MKVKYQIIMWVIMPLKENKVNYLKNYNTEFDPTIQYAINVFGVDWCSACNGTKDAMNEVAPKTDPKKVQFNFFNIETPEGQQSLADSGSNYRGRVPVIQRCKHDADGNITICNIQEGGFNAEMLKEELYNEGLLTD